MFDDVKLDLVVHKLVRRATKGDLKRERVLHDDANYSEPMVGVAFRIVGVSLQEMCTKMVGVVLNQLDVNGDSELSGLLLTVAQTGA